MMKSLYIISALSMMKSLYIISALSMMKSLYVSLSEGQHILFQLPKPGKSLLPYFFGMTEFLSFRNNPKNLNPSYKMDLDLWDCLGRVKLVL